MLPTPPPGFLRVLVVFHEPQLLGASTSVLRVVDRLGAYGWSVSGWIPGTGPLRSAAEGTLAAVAGAERQLRFSRAGWRSGPGLLRRAASVPGYLSSFRTELLRFRPHVVHANTLLALPEALAARRFGLPVVLHVHEVPPADAKRRAALAVAGRAADVVACVSQAAVDIVTAEVSSAPVQLVYNGVPSSGVRPASRERGPFTVGTVGTVSRTKGTDVFLRAAARALEQRPELRFEHAGQRDLHEDAGLDGELEALLDGTRLGAATKLHGRLDAAEALARLDLFVLPSRSEAFPLASLEAMSAGVPVIATRVGGIPEQIEHLRHGVLVPSDDPAALAQWIVRLHDEPELRRRLAVAAAERVREEFTLDMQAAGLHNAYLTALNLRFGPPQVRRRSRATDTGVR